MRINFFGRIINIHPPSRKSTSDACVHPFAVHIINVTMHVSNSKLAQYNCNPEHYPLEN